MKYALALEGGGTRGAFEAGVWKAIRELNINIDSITGTSIGAINGAMFASGADAVSMWKNIKPNDVLNVTDHSFKSYLKAVFNGGIDTSPLKIFLENHLSEKNLRESPIDFGLCACNAKDISEINLFKKDIPQGKMIDYILASASCPIFKPWRINGKKYIDGGIRNNLPINMLIDKGYKNIIAVSVKGIGIKKDNDICGINIIEINSPKATSGILDFNKDGIIKGIDSGYCECMKAFGQCVGNKYYFYCDDYFRSVEIYGQTILNSLEKAAEITGVYKYRIYTVKEIRNLINKQYKSHKLLYKLVSYMLKKDNSLLRKKIDSVPLISDAANAIAYFLKN